MRHLILMLEVLMFRHDTVKMSLMMLLCATFCMGCVGTKVYTGQELAVVATRAAREHPPCDEKRPQDCLEMTEVVVAPSTEESGKEVAP